MVAGKVGKHHVKEQDVDVQLGEELVEHLREIKVSVKSFERLNTFDEAPAANHRV